LAIRVMIGGKEVVVDSRRDLEEVLPLVDGGPRESGSREANQVDDKLTRAGRLIMAVTSAAQQQVIVALAKKGKQTDAELRTELGLKDNKALAGVLAGLTKQAKKAGLSPRDVLRTEATRGSEGRIYTYQLGKALKDALDLAAPKAPGAD